MDYEIDPDNNNFFSVNDNCCYYTKEQYNQGKLRINSVINYQLPTSAEEVYTKFDHIKELYQVISKPLFKPFGIIATFKTWINIDQDQDFELESYKFR